MDRLNWKDVLRESQKPSPYFRTGSTLSGPVDLTRIGQRSALAQAVLSNQSKKKHARSEREHREHSGTA